MEDLEKETKRVASSSSRGILFSEETEEEDIPLSEVLAAGFASFDQLVRRVA